MTKPFQQWTVLPHGKLMQIDENILTVVGEIHMPLMDLPRRMTIVRLTDASLVVFSAIALDADEMSALEAYGRPAWLVVPRRQASTRRQDLERSLPGDPGRRTRGRASEGRRNGPGGHGDRPFR
jgi:hypothetical protein